MFLTLSHRQTAAMNISDLPTPTLLLDEPRLVANIARMQASADRLGVALRPHLKTLKSAAAAEALIAAGARGITVSTLKEAGYFLDHGITDITYAVGVEASVRNILFLYAGTKSSNDIDIENRKAETDYSGIMTFGFGFVLDRMRFNYAFCPNDSLEDTHKMTFGFEMR